jgi:hypothetical protein
VNTGKSGRCNVTGGAEAMTGAFSTRHPFHELAWSAFYFHTVYEEDRTNDRYIRISNNHALLGRLRRNPTTSALNNDLTTEVLPWLNNWNCRIPTDQYAAIASDIIAFLNNPINRQHLLSLRSFSHITVSLTPALSAAINHLFNAFMAIKHIGPTAASKLLHLLHPHIVMWDEAIAAALNTQRTPDGYVEYHVKAQTDAIAVTHDFQNTYPTYSETPEDFLFNNLRLNTQKTFAKLLDEHYWIKFTEEIDIPPLWHPDK